MTACIASHARYDFRDDSSMFLPERKVARQIARQKVFSFVTSEPLLRLDVSPATRSSRCERLESRRE